MKPADKKEVNAFLNRIHQKAKLFGIVYEDDRGKNFKALAELEITPSLRDEVIMSLKAEDYYKGPRPCDLTSTIKSEMWEFGKLVSGNEVYIKISPGLNNSSPVCISFHPPERSINYPFKDE